MSEWIRCPKCGTLMIVITAGHICPLCGHRLPAQTITTTAGTSVEYVPVIRCKDCKWYYRGGATCMFWDGANSMCGDDYCSRAERKEE